MQSVLVRERQVSYRWPVIVILFVSLVAFGATYFLPDIKNPCTSYNRMNPDQELQFQESLLRVAPGGDLHGLPTNVAPQALRESIANRLFGQAYDLLSTSNQRVVLRGVQDIGIAHSVSDMFSRGECWIFHYEETARLLEQFFHRNA